MSKRKQMIEDKLLILRFRFGSGEALRRIYEKYKDYLLRLAVALSDVNTAEDVVHDVFVRFARTENRLKMRGSLKGYLRACVVNGVHNKNREKRQRPTVGLDEAEPVASDSIRPENWVICKEESGRINDAMAQIPYQQREAIVLHLYGDMKFAQIAQLQAVSLKTVQSRYRYGLDKLRGLLDGEVEK